MIYFCEYTLVHNTCIQKLTTFTFIYFTKQPMKTTKHLLIMLFQKLNNNKKRIFRTIDSHYHYKKVNKMTKI